MTDETKTDQSIAVKGAQGVVAAEGMTAEQVALMRKHAGKQKFSVKELLIPQLKIVQANTYAKKSNPEYVEGAEEGDLIDTINLQPTKPPGRIVVVRFATTYMESEPYPGKIVKIWGEDASGYNAARGDFGVRITAAGNEIRETASYHCLFLNPDGSSLPCMMHVGGTSWKEAKRLNTLLGGFELMGGDGPFIAPPFARVYTVNTVPLTDGKNTWMGWKFMPSGLTLSQKFGTALYQKALDFEESILKGHVQVQDDGVHSGREGDASPGNGPRRAAHNQGVGPDRGEEPPASAYQEELGPNDNIPF